MGIDETSFIAEDEKTPPIYRRDGLHLYGVDDLKTNEIFEFFADYNPYSLEWINDSSCNLVWKNENKVLKAIVEMTDEYDSTNLTTSNLRDVASRPPKNFKWRITRLKCKEKFKLFVRFIRTLTDRKRKGAESKSRFYVRYGNPNYGNLRGIISESKRREMRFKHLEIINSTMDPTETLKPSSIETKIVEAIENNNNDSSRELVAYNFGISIIFFFL